MSHLSDWVDLVKWVCTDRHGGFLWTNSLKALSVRQHERRLIKKGPGLHQVQGLLRVAQLKNKKGDKMPSLKLFISRLALGCDDSFLAGSRALTFYLSDFSHPCLYFLRCWADGAAPAPFVILAFRGRMSAPILAPASLASESFQVWLLGDLASCWRLSWFCRRAVCWPMPASYCCKLLA